MKRSLLKWKTFGCHWVDIWQQTRGTSFDETFGDAQLGLITGNGLEQVTVLGFVFFIDKLTDYLIAVVSCVTVKWLQVELCWKWISLRGNDVNSIWLNEKWTSDDPKGLAVFQLFRKLRTKRQYLWLVQIIEDHLCPRQSFVTIDCGNRNLAVRNSHFISIESFQRKRERMWKGLAKWGWFFW